MGFFDRFFKKQGQDDITNRILKKLKHKYRRVKVAWNGPKYVIAFPNDEKPFVPYFRVEGQEGQWTEAPSTGYLYYDPIEDIPEFQEIDRIVEKLIDEELGDYTKLMGSCHRVWSLKKRVLEEYYGITWHSPTSLNPTCCID